MKRCLHCNKAFENFTWQCTHCEKSPIFSAGFLAFAPDLSVDQGFQDTYFEKLAELEVLNFWFRSRNTLILWALKEHFPFAMDLLEIGCGTGFVLSGVANHFPNLRLSGSEISSVGLAYAAKRVPNATFFQMDARAIPFTQEFDVIGAFDVLEHVHEDQIVLTQMHRALRPGGGILLTVPQHAMLWSKADEYACHVRRYDSKDLVTKVINAGFKVTRLTSFVSLLLPFMWASRRWSAVDPREYDPLSEFRIGGFGNKVLERFMDIERLVIQAGLNFPLGGSLLLVARKENENAI